MDVLVVESEAAPAAAVHASLEAAGLRAKVATTCAEALELARRTPPALFVIEMRMPDLSGLGLCRALRDEPSLSRVPIVMLSESAAEMDRVVAFEMGVDDFVIRPFHPRELALRALAILRRTRLRAPPTAPAGVLRHRGLSLDLLNRLARVEERPVDLTAREFDVLAILMRHRGRVLSREQILHEAWGFQPGKTARVVDTHVKWIRRKLGGAATYLETLRGVGYRFTDRSEGP